MESLSYYIPRIWPSLPIWQQAHTQGTQKAINPGQSWPKYSGIRAPCSLGIIWPPPNMAANFFYQAHFLELTWGHSSLGEYILGCSKVEYLDISAQTSYLHSRPILREENNEKSIFPTNVTNRSPQSGKIGAGQSSSVKSTFPMSLSQSCFS